VHEQRLAELVQRTGATMRKSLAPEPGKSLDMAAVVFCVKPQDLTTVAQGLKGRIAPGSLVVSILAGVTIADVEQALEFKGAVVRAMPNIAATVGAAATAMCHNAACDEPHRKLAERLFGAIGEADWTKESLLDAVTGLSGSGPAYLYMIIEALTDGGVKMGIPRVLAHRLATQTVLGAALLVKETGLHPAVLRDQVTTPGGTTINAIHELEDRGLRAMLISAVETATNRAAHLRKK
jgi:pyrroline-5-carboxylate reductase